MTLFADNDARLAALRRPAVTPVLFFDWRTETVPGLNRAFWTDYPADITESGQTYRHRHPIYQISLPEVNSELGRELFELRLSDPEGAWRNALQDNYTGLRITVRVSFVTQTEPSIVRTPTFVIYTGRSVALSNDFSATTGHTLIVVFSGPFAKLDGDNGWWTSIHDQAQRDETDTAFEFAHASRDIQWGRET